MVSGRSTTVRHTLFALMLVGTILCGELLATIDWEGSLDPAYDDDLAPDPWVVNDDFFIVGFEGDGTLWIQDGSAVTVAGMPFIGDYADEYLGTSGTLYLTGSESTLTIDSGGGDDQYEFFIGPRAAGYLYIQDRAVLSSYDAIIGGSLLMEEEEDSGAVNGVVPGAGHVEVTGGAQWNLQGDSWVTVGGFGTGELTIQDTGDTPLATSVTADTSEIGLFPDSVGDVLVGPSGTWTLTNDLVVGVWGEGNLTVSGGGQVQSTRGWIGGVDPDLMGYTEDDEGVFDGLGNPDGVGNVLVTGPESTWNAGDSLVVGAWGTGTLDIEEGGTVTAAEVFIGGMPITLGLEDEFTRDLLPTGTGIVTVTGEGSLLGVLSEDSLYVGYSGEGTLNIEAGGAVTSGTVAIGGAPDVTGTVLVTGAGTTPGVVSTLTAEDIQVGAWGTGFLTVSDSAEVTANRLVIGGLDSTSVPPEQLDARIVADFSEDVGTGTVTVTEGGSLDVDGTTYVGNYGEGALNVTGGGQAITGELAVGVAPGSSGTVLVSGADGDVPSHLEVDMEMGPAAEGYVPGVMIVGGYGEGDVTVTNGGLLTVDDVLYVGGYTASELDFEGDGDPDGMGIVTVAGEDSTLIADKLAIGYSGDGTLEILGDATVTSNMAVIGGTAEGTGHVLVDNTPGTWTNTGSVVVGAYGEGELTVSNDSHVAIGETLFIGGYVPEEVEDIEFDYEYAPNGTGIVTVEDVGSLLEAEHIGVGAGGEGTLEILNGAEVQAEAVVVGMSNVEGITGSVLVDGQVGEDRSTLQIASLEADEIPAALGMGEVIISNGGQVIVEGQGVLNVGGKITVGSEGVGSMEITGGTVAADDLDIGGTDPDWESIEEYLDPETVFTEGTGDVTVTGADAHLNVAEDLVVGFAGSGTLLVDQGASLMSESAFIGAVPEAMGEVEITGGSTWDAGENIVVGLWGQGELTISGGAETTTEVTTGEMYIGGTSLEIVAGGEQEYDEDLVPDGTGIVTVTGNAVLDIVEDFTLYVGYAGTGELYIEDGGQVLTDAAVIGAGPDVSGTLELDDGEMIVDWDMIVGAWGDGEVTIGNGSTVTAAELYIGGFDAAESGLEEVLGPAQGTGIVTVTGGESLLEVLGGNTTYVGYSNEGTLNILAGAQATTDAAIVGVLEGSTGLVTVDGDDSTWSIVGGGGVPDASADGDGTVNISDGGLVEVDSEDAVLLVGGMVTVASEGEGTVNITDGGFIASESMGIGASPGSSGTVTIDGVHSNEEEIPSEWDVSGSAFVGGHGTGNLTVSDGGLMDIHGSLYIGGFDADEFDVETPEAGSAPDGMVVVTGEGSTLYGTGLEELYVGYSGDGTLNVLDGGYVESGIAAIGALPDSVGDVTVDGLTEGEGESTWENTGSMVVGGYGDGSMTISNGGEVYVRDTLYIGGFDAQSENFPTVEGVDPAGTGEVTVTGANSALFVGGAATLHVGYSGEGELNILDEGEVVSLTSSIGLAPGGDGVVHVDGGNWLNNGDLYVGGEGDGELSVVGGGYVFTTGMAYLAPGVDGTAYVRVEGEGTQWEVGESLFVGGHEEGGAGTAFLDVLDGGEVIVQQELYIWEPATVRGDGTISVASMDTVHNYGTIAPGDDGIGTLTVNGSVVFHEGSTFAVEISNTASDRLEVVQGVTIEGGTVEVDSVGTIFGEHEYEIISADSVVGEFEDLDTALLNFEFSELDYPDGASVWLYVSAANFNDPNIARTDNQRAVGGALQQIPDEDNPVTGAVQGLATDDEVRGAYDQLSGQTRPALAPMTVAGTSKFLGTVSSRAQTVKSGLVAGAFDSSLMAAAGPDQAVGTSSAYDTAVGGQTFAVGNGSSALADRRWGLWGRGYGLFGDRDAEAGMPGYAYNIYGGSFGVDYQFTESVLAGLVGGMSEGDVDFDSSRDNTDFGAAHIGLYGSLAWDRWSVDAIVTYANLDYETRRFVDVLDEQLLGNFDGYELASYVEVSHSFDLAPDLRLSPLASVQYTYLNLDSYTETGGDSALSFDEQTHESIRGSLGARLTKRLIESAGDFRADLQVRGRWVHEFGDNRASVDTAFASDPTVIFTVKDEEISRDSAVLGAGLSAELNKRTRAYLDYDTRLNSDEGVHVFSASLQYRW